ncbi:MAG: MarR family transcriptional regulator [Myxococcaceae bacterium]|nr:MarR family transcriptional regulator [Myxococcaceae bacterium]
MKGYLWSATPGPGGAPLAHLARWETVAVDAVGNVIEFWGFKRNQGRVWAFLYLRDAAFTAAEIEKELELSKGGVSMLVRDLERWGVIVRVRSPGDASWRYRAETDLMKMARQVIEEREFAFIARIRLDLDEALRLAESARANKESIRRLKRMGQLAEATERALKLFLRTSQLDVKGMFGVFAARS